MDKELKELKEKDIGEPLTEEELENLRSGISDEYIAYINYINSATNKDLQALKKLKEEIFPSKRKR